MERVKRAVSLVLCFIMVLGFLPMNVFATGIDTNAAPSVSTMPTTDDLTVLEGAISTTATSEEAKTYVLVSTPTAGKNYIIASGNSGEVYALKENTTTGTAVTVNAATGSITASYIETSDNSIVWTASSGMNFKSVNGGYYLNCGLNSSFGYSLSFDTSSGSDWTAGTNALYYEGIGTSYLHYDDVWTMNRGSGYYVYFYEEQAAETVTLSSIAVTTAPTKTAFTVGEEFSSDGLVVTATYSDGSTKAVTGYTLSGYDMTTAGEQTVTVTYTEGDVTQTATFTITVSKSLSADATVTGIQVSGAKTNYSLGETFTTEGMVVTATYSDGTTAEVTDYEVSEVDMTTEGTKTVTVSYTYKDETVTTTFDITVTGEDSNEVTLPGTTTTTTTKTVYVLTSSISSGNSYLIVNGNSAGTYYALANNSGSVSATGVTVKTDSTIGTYIELTDATDELWTVGSGYTFKCDDGYLYRASDNSTTLRINNSSTDWSYSTSNHRLSYTRSGDTYYLRYNNGWAVTSSSSSASSIYFYVPTEIEVETTVDTTVTYTMRAENLKQVVDSTNSATLTASLSYCLQGNGADLTTLPSGGSYSFTVLTDANGIISGITDGTVTFTGNTGTAKVKVAYTWTVDGKSYTVYKNITVEATDPYYTLDLHKASYSYTEVNITEFEEGVSYFIKNADGTYTHVTEYVAGNKYYIAEAVIGEEITAPIAIKGVEKGDTYSVWAVIKKFDGTSESGTDIGDVPDDQILWVSSDTSIATVDPSTGIITFTGKDGTVTITAYYLDENGKVRAEDSVEISVTKTNYTVPGDGTDDFPEYPKQGAIRHDKYAVAVGNFSQTGVAKVELSMTGVPYGTSAKTDVVVMVDMTASMSDDDVTAAQLAVKELVETLVYDEENDVYDTNIQLFVSSFSSGSSDTSVTITDHLSGTTISSDSELAAAKTAIEAFNQSSQGGGTRYNIAMADVYATLNRDGHADNQFVVFVSDGVATAYAPLIDGALGTTITGENSETNSLAAGWFDSTGEVTSSFKTEYYSYMIKSAGIPIYTVGANLTALSDAADLLNHMSSNYSPDGKTSTGQTKYSFFTTTSGGITDETLEIFRGIGMDIKEAATDVIVADQITPEYTMIFDIPTGSVNISGTLSDQEFYIEVMDYPMNAVYASDGTTITDYVRGTGTSLIKLYLGVDNGTYYAASDSEGAKFADPVFGQDAIGTMFYWTTDNTDTGISVTVDGTTYNFDKVGISNKDTSFDEDKWFNMTSGAYAYGTINSTNTSTDLIIATPYFAYNASTKMLYWTAEKLSTNELAISYFLYLDNSATEVGKDIETDPGTYPTNVEATITYTNFQDTRCQQEFPIPQLTWKGAQVSYVFYLVNAAGQPVNRAGKVVPFSEAVYVTNTYTHSVVWNDETGVTSLNAHELAKNIVPDVYTLYDTAAYYEINVYKTNSGSDQDHFIIEGGSDVTNKTTTKVFNTKSDADHRYSTYGAYSNVGGTYKSSQSGTEYTATTTTGFDYCNTTVAFAVLWNRELKEDVVVVDYGLDVVIDVTANDAVASGVVGVMASKRSDVEMNTGTYDDAAKAQSVAVMLGTSPLATAKVESLTSVRFSLNEEYGMEFNDAAVFYYESDVNFYDDKGELQTKTMYSSVTVIPATTIYYEDDFVTYESFTWSDSAGGWTKSDDNLWVQVGSASTSTQDQDRPGEQGDVTIGSGLDADNIYGYDGAYAEMNLYSNGAAMMATVDYDNYAQASFDFWGTGFDVISLTSNTTGTILVDVYGYDTNGNMIATPVGNYVVDTYYGYDIVEYRMYTYTYHVYSSDFAQWEIDDGEKITAEEYADATDEIRPDDPEDGDSYCVYRAVFELAVDNPDALYQIPVMKIEGLNYGHYKAVIKATYDSFLDHTEENPTNETGSYDFYLDAIRIYDPANNGAGNDVISGAYEADHEAYPHYFELRNAIISANEFENLEPNVTEVSGVVYIDGAITGSESGNNPANFTKYVKDYLKYGPNNELYLSQSQAISFAFNADEIYVPDGYEIDRVHIGLKIVSGTNATVKMYDAAKTNAVAIDGMVIKTATDMYYDITDLLNSTALVIYNSAGDGSILSITDIKVTYKKASTDENNAAASSVSVLSVASETETADSIFLVSHEIAQMAVDSIFTNAAPESPEMPEPPVEPEIFAPSVLSVKVNKTKVKEGDTVKVTINTSNDVQCITVNGKLVTKYNNIKGSVIRSWVVELTAEGDGEMQIEVVAYNSEKVASEPVSTTVQVKKAKWFFDWIR